MRTHVPQFRLAQPARDHDGLLRTRGAAGSHPSRGCEPSGGSASDHRSEPDHGPHSAARATLFFDGGASPNPGCGGGGFYLIDDRGHEITREAVGIFPYTNVTNNQAEYIGLITGLLEAESQGLRRLAVKGDSELVINQMNGYYEARSDRIVALNQYANEIERRFQRVTYAWISRQENAVADSLASQGKTNYADTEVTLNTNRNPPVFYNY